MQWRLAALLGKSFPGERSGTGAGDAGLSAPARCSLSWGQRCYVNWLSYRKWGRSPGYEQAASRCHILARSHPGSVRHRRLWCSGIWWCTGCVCLNSWKPSSSSLISLIICRCLHVTEKMLICSSAQMLPTLQITSLWFQHHGNEIINQPKTVLGAFKQNF